MLRLYSYNINFCKRFFRCFVAIEEHFCLIAAYGITRSFNIAFTALTNRRSSASKSSVMPS